MCSSDLAAGQVDDRRAPLHALEGRGAEDAAGAVGQRQQVDDDVAGGQQVSAVSTNGTDLRL